MSNEHFQQLFVLKHVGMSDNDTNTHQKKETSVKLKVRPSRLNSNVVENAPR